MPQDVVFQEMLEVSVGTDEFKRGLEALEKEYKEFLGRLGGGVSGKEILDVGAVGSMNSALKDIVQNLTVVRTELSSTMSDFANHINESLSEVSKVIDQKFTATTKAVKDKASVTVEEEQALIQRILSEIEAALATQTNINTLFVGTQKKILGELFNLVETRGEGVLKNLSQANQRWLDNQIRQVEQAFLQMDSAGEKAAEGELQGVQKMISLRQRALFEEYARELEERAAFQKKLKEADDGSQADETRRAQARQQAITTVEKEIEAAHTARQKRLREEDGETDAEFRRGIQARQQAADSLAKHLETLDQANRSLAASEERAQAASTTVATAQAKLREKQDGDATSKQVENARRVLDAATNFERLRTEIAQNSARIRESIANNESTAIISDLRRQTQALEAEAGRAQRALVGVLKSEELGDRSIFQRVFGKFMSDLPEFVAGVFRLTVGLAASYKILNAITAIIGAIPKAFKEGWQYLTQLEERSEELQGVIAGTVEFTKSVADNLKISGSAASEVVKKFQDIAVKDNLKPDNLMSGFKSFMEGGGANLVHDLNEAVRVTELFSLALKGSGVNAQTTRRLVSEIPKLLDGTIEPSSKLLQMLHVSKDEWLKMREEAEKHHNLVQLIEPKMRAFVAVTDLAGDRQHDLTETVKLMSDRLFAVLAEPMWKTFIGYLQQTKKFLADNDGSLKGIASSLGGFVVTLAKIVIMTVKLLYNFTGMKELLFGLVLGAQALMEAVGVIVDGIDVVLSDFQFLFTLLADPNTWKHPMDALRAFWSHATQESDKFFDSFKERALHISDFIGNTHYSQTGGEDFLNRGFDPSFGLPDRRKAKGDDTLAKLRNEFNKELDVWRHGAKTGQEILQQMVADGTISHKEYTQSVIMNLNDESKHVQELTKKYEDLALKRVKAGPARTSFIGSLQNLSRDVTAGNRNKDLEVETDLDKKAQASALKSDRELRRIALDHQKFMVETAKAEADAGYITKAEAVDKEIALLRDEHSLALDLLDDEIKEVKNDEFKRADLLLKRTREESQFNDRVVALTQRRIAVGDEEYRKKQEHLRALMTLDQQFADEERRHSAAMSGSLYAQVSAQKATLQERIRNIQVQATQVAQELSAAQAMNKKGEVVDALIEKAKALGLEWQKLVNAQQENSGDGVQRRGQRNVFQDVFGVDNFDDLKDAFGDFEDGLAVAANAAQALPGIIGNIVNAFKQGGVAGGIGSIMSTAGSFIPGPVGSILSIGGSVLSAISGLFTRAAKKIAEEIKKGIDGIMAHYKAGETTLSQTIQQLEAKRAEAITRLSGKKGGQDELSKLLPSIDDEISSLKTQQTQIIEQFENGLTVLKLNSDELGNFLRSWQDINKQVKDYIGAGGDAIKANEFLSLSLKKLQTDAQTSLNEAEQEAIQDAIQLNDLLQQRIKLTEDFKKTEFDLINADAIERRQAGAVSRGRELSQKRKEYQDQLDQLNQQIALQDKKVTKEKAVFDLASNITDLHRRDEELTLIALDQQIAKWRDIQSIVQGITRDSNGSYILGQGLGVTIGAIQVSVNVTGGDAGDAGDIGAGIGKATVDAINDEFRYGNAQPYRLSA